MMLVSSGRRWKTKTMSKSGTEPAKVFEDRGQWRVEWFDDDGRCELEIFTGPDARAKALRARREAQRR